MALMWRRMWPWSWPGKGGRAAWTWDNHARYVDLGWLDGAGPNSRRWMDTDQLEPNLPPPVRLNTERRAHVDRNWRPR